jgi:hypothetical protein
LSIDSGREQVQPINLFKRQEGVILLELVLTLSLLTVIFMATVTFSFLFADYCGAQKVAREGAREASITRDTGLARNRAQEAAWLWGLDPDRMEIDFVRGDSGVTCTVHYVAKPFSRTFPLILNGKKLEDCHLRTRAVYAWSDTR